MPASKKKKRPAVVAKKKGRAPLVAKKKSSSPLVVVRNSKIHGKGVFANALLPKGSRIIEYKGRHITEKAADDKYGDDAGTHTFLFLIENEMVIDANYEGNSSRWINHSCDPNCDANEEEGRVYIEALRTIKPGQELTYDYQLIVEERYTPALKRMYACGCGSKKCRGHILGPKR